MQDKFDWVDTSCRGREDAFDEAWEEYRALATEANNAVKARRPMPATESMLGAMFQVQPNPRSNSFLDVKGQSHNLSLTSLNTNIESSILI